ncbi:MAG: 4-hydroxybenzoate octaprenyltransferase [Gammaproteobacteria bacterium]|nr:4-hydroxybenzoate octaprenyltransferase [Gammaproteobacteria bacterium]
MRIDRPVGVLLLLWPTLAALWMAANGTPPLGLVAVFTLGAFLMRAAGCVINDFADRNVDGAVQRTAARPLATGTVSPRAALVLFATLSVLAATLLPFLNELARWLAVAGIAIAATYPFTKRWTHMPQVVLGAAFSWGIVMAFAAVTGEVASSGWLMFVASVLWIVAYDTLYAMVDREDDIRVGIKSTAILFGNADRFMIGVLQASTLITLLLLADKLSYGILFDGSLVAITLLFAYQQRLIVKREPEGCFRAFANNVWVGFALFAGVVLQTTFGASIESLPPALP